MTWEWLWRELSMFIQFSISYFFWDGGWGGRNSDTTLTEPISLEINAIDGWTDGRTKYFTELRGLKKGIISKSPWQISLFTLEGRRYKHPCSPLKAEHTCTPEHPWRQNIQTPLYTPEGRTYKHPWTPWRQKIHTNKHTYIKAQSCSKLKSINQAETTWSFV